MKKLILMLSMLLMLSVTACDSKSKDDSGKKESEKSLVAEVKKDVKKMNAKCPKEVIQGIVLTSVEYNSEDKVVEYNYECELEDLTPEQRAQMEEDAKEKVGSNAKTNKWLKGGISVRYNYNNLSGEHIFDITVYADDSAGDSADK